jgi:hypothetical protein
VDGALAGDPNVDGILPTLHAQVSAVNQTSRQAEPVLNLLGADPARLSPGFAVCAASTARPSTWSPSSRDGVVLSETAADALDARSGTR